MKKPSETDLYPPVKAYLEAQGYEVKGEIGAVDVMAVRGDEDPVLVELKLGFSLVLLHQGVARQSVTDAVYLAVPHSGNGLKENLGLCRRLGLGLMTVRLRDEFVEVLADPVPYRPRKSIKHKGRLLREFARRVGDPNAGGSTRVGIVTSYRQDALCCATYLEGEGASKGSVVAKATAVPKATRIMADDYYGWFERVTTGVYILTPKGGEDLDVYGRIELPKLLG
jgi:hypothetical protein